MLELLLTVPLFFFKLILILYERGIECNYIIECIYRMHVNPINVGVSFALLQSNLHSKCVLTRRRLNSTKVLVAAQFANMYLYSLKQSPR